MTDLRSTRKAAAWMAGWLSLMVIIAIAGREAMRELGVFQLMEMRSVIGLVLLNFYAIGGAAFAIYAILKVAFQGAIA